MTVKLSLSLLVLILSFFKIFGQDILPEPGQKDSIKILSLTDCIQIAVENNHKIQASNEGINIAAAQKKQAESGYWPQLSLKAAYTLMDQDPSFILPSFKMNFPVSLPGLTLNLNDIPVPEQDVKLMDKQNIHGELSLTYPLYTGGKVQSLNKQAELGISIAKLEKKKTDLEVRYDVKRFYYAVVLAKKIFAIGNEALERLEATLNLTESLYKNGSGKVTKIDYLRNKVIVDQVRALVLEIKGKIRVAKEALLFVLGKELPYDFDVRPDEISNDNFKLNTDSLVADAYIYNPDWSKINSAVEIYKEKIDEAQSGYLPSVALFGSLNQNFNSYQYGIVNNDNKTVWTVGLGIEMPIFSGFRTSGEVDEAKAYLKKINDEKKLLHDAIILQVKNACSDVKTSEDQLGQVIEAKNSAEENSSLNERAFQMDMVETKDLIEAQLMESFVQVQYEKALYDHFVALAKLELIIGKDINMN